MLRLLYLGREIINGHGRFSVRISASGQLLQAFGLINPKPTILFPPTVVALLDCPSFLAGHGNRLALSLQHLNLAKLYYYYLLRRKFFSLPSSFSFPVQYSHIAWFRKSRSGQYNVNIKSKPLSH
jgi:hypothetical protein